jgi:hypothetical protein
MKLRVSCGSPRSIKSESQRTDTQGKNMLTSSLKSIAYRPSCNFISALSQVVVFGNLTPKGWRCHWVSFWCFDWPSLSIWFLATIASYLSLTMIVASELSIYTCNLLYPLNQCKTSWKNGETKISCLMVSC